MSSWLLALYTRFGVWLYLVAPSPLLRAVHQLRTVALDIMISAQHPMYASHADRMDRLRETYTLIISGSTTTEQMLALMLVIVLQAVYIVLLMRFVHRQRDNRSDMP